MIDQESHGKQTGKENDRHSEADGEVHSVGHREHEGANGACVGGLLVEPEGDRQEKDCCNEPCDSGENSGELWGELGAVRWHHNAPVTVHANQGESPQQDEATHELHTETMTNIMQSMLEAVA